LFKKTTTYNADTKDILYSLNIAVPAAIAQAKQLNLAEIVGINEYTSPTDAGLMTGNWIRNNVQYKLDPFNEQNIQLPSSLLRTKKGDCKSLSLLFLSILESAGYNAGFRFVSYKKNSSYTHVYNFICTNQNKYFTFDCCIRNLVENQNYKLKKDMRVNYLAGTPVMMGEDDVQGINKPTIMELLTDDIYMSGSEYIGRKRRPILRNLLDKGKNAVKVVSLAPERGAILALIDVNFAGFARKLDEARKKDPKTFEEFWLKLGGKISSLNKAIDKGKNKRAIKPKNRISGATDVVYIGGPDSICYVGEGEGGTDAAKGFNIEAIMKIVGQATPIIGALTKLFKKLFIKDKPEDEGKTPDVADDEQINPDGKDFVVNDPASPEAETYAKTKQVPTLSEETTKGGGTSFKPSPIMIAAGVGVAALGIYFLTKKKSK